MAWNNKVDKDELAKEMFGEDAATVKARLDKLNIIETSLTEAAKKQEAQSILITQMAETIKNLKVSSPYDAPPKKEDENKGPQYKADWGEDADAAFTERFATNTAPLIGTILDTRGEMVKREVMEVLDKQYHDWFMFADEISEYAKAARPEQKVNAEFWKNCYFVCKGKHAEEIERDKNQKSGKFYLESASSTVTVRGDENKDPVALLTDKDKAVAEGLGVPLEVYAKNKLEFGKRSAV